jgi:hypothetical protein
MSRPQRRRSKATLKDDQTLLVLNIAASHLHAKPGSQGTSFVENPNAAGSATAIRCVKEMNEIRCDPVVGAEAGVSGHLDQQPQCASDYGSVPRTTLETNTPSTVWQ